MVDRTGREIKIEVIMLSTCSSPSKGRRDEEGGGWVGEGRRKGGGEGAESFFESLSLEKKDGEKD